LERVVGMGKEIIKQPVSDVQKGSVLTLEERWALQDAFHARAADNSRERDAGSGTKPETGASTGMKPEEGALRNLDGARMVAKPEEVKGMVEALSNVLGRTANALELHEDAKSMQPGELEAAIGASRTRISQLKGDLERPAEARRKGLARFRSCLPEITAAEGTPEYDAQVNSLVQTARDDFFAVIDRIKKDGDFEQRSRAQSWLGHFIYNTMEIEVAQNRIEKHMPEEETKLRIYEHVLASKRGEGTV